ncbi:hypothetical protein K4K54_012135 [Colletotrichum sp. SAR 10_86]|nr:hypothetical protein K4K53_009985 [Colletotrichum sp. SAR 10_77]KAI8216978.1 hypothetical protein K4K54_012135 [Colletotrichum sp. SAR 10_86]
MAAISDLLQAAQRAVPRESSPTRAAANCILGIFILWWLFSTVKQYLRLRHFRGPPLAAFSKLWHLKTVWGPKAHLDFYDVVKKYGNLARVGPNDLIMEDPELVKRVLGARSTYRRADWYDAVRFHPKKNNVLSMRDEDEHAKLRAKMAAGYNGKHVQDFEKKLDNNLSNFFRLLGRYIDAGQPFDFARKVQYFTLDVITDLAFGDPMGFMAEDGDLYDYIETTEKAMPSFITLTVFPIAKSFAGSDTSATTIRATILHVITNPRVLNRLLAEIDAAAPHTAQPVIADAEARALPYLQAVIKEGLRIFQPAASFAAKEAPPEGDVWKGTFIPGGTRIGWSVWAVLRREETWGKDSAEFRPERWIMEADGGSCTSAEKLREMEGVWELVFSYGRHQCLGKPVAVMELNKVFFELFRRFDFSICYPLTPWKTANCGVHLQSEMWMRGYRRA